MSSFPQTPVPQTPGVAAAGWMDDIKRVINFDSVEEFWGCVLPSCSPTFALTSTQTLQQYHQAVRAATEGKLLSVQG